MSYYPRKRGVAVFAIALVLLFTVVITVPTVSQAATHHPKNWVQRHPTATGFAAGVATRHALKVSAARKKARGQKLNWAERHPTLTGIGAGTATRHIIKKHTPQ